ncbi:hypothetical protein [Chryseobacterium sp.]|uniref:hypothetical protein n=1 Tax=Chryseobacterium sp. TaxID=1871047 RepID=UPI003219BB80
MKTFKVKLSIGEVILTEDDIRLLKARIDKEFITIDQTPYEELKASKNEVIEKTLKEMGDDELLQLAKVNDLHRPEGYYTDEFSRSIYSEMFKRKGLGYKALRRLSAKQREYLTSLGLRYK